MNFFKTEEEKKYIKEICTENILNRKEEIEKLKKYFEMTGQENRVISINSAWGSGKTTFIKMLGYSLEEGEAKYLPLYFNAWENDDSENPLISILTEFKEVYKNENEIKSLIESGKAFASKAPKFILKALLGYLPGLGQAEKENIADFIEGILEDGVVDGIKSALEISDMDKLDAIIKDIDIFDMELARKKLKQQFKDKLKKFQQANDKKVIIFIDELDRCRPTFAIETLEIIKHFFDIDNYIFVISWDKEQLSHSIATVYGQNMDSAGYLRRFIDLEYSLKKPNLREYFRKKIELELQNIHFWNSSLRGSNWNIFLFFIAIDKFKLSLRDIDKLILEIKSNYGITRFLEYPYLTYTKILGIIFFFLKMKYPLKYLELVHSTLSDDELRDFSIFIKLFMDEIISEYNEETSYGNQIRKISQFEIPVIEEILKYCMGIKKISYLNPSEITIDQENFEIRSLLAIENKNILVLDISI